MSTKRKHSEDGGAIHPSRKAQVQPSQSASPKLPRRFEPRSAMHKKQAHASSVNSVKKKIRDVTRRLERSEDLPANVKAEDERALAAYQQELGAAEDEKVRQKMIKRYHMVRFFERQKATRHIKKLRKALTEATEEDEVARLTKELHTADVDLNYTQYSPLNEIYISIYRQNAEEDEHKDHSKKPEMWHEVERRMEEGGLDQLRNGVRSTLVSRPKPRPSGANGQQVTAKPNLSGPSQQSGNDKIYNSAAGTGKLKEDTTKPKRLSKHMTDEEFFKLNRRQKRAELKRSGNLASASLLSQESADASSMAAATDMDIDDGGGFFEE